MNKRDLAKALRKQYGFSWSVSNGIIDTLLGTIKSGLRSRDHLTLHNFGSFDVQEFSTRKYRDINTGRIKIKGIRDKVKFTPSPNILEP